MINRRHFLISTSGAIAAVTLPNAMAKPQKQSNKNELLDKKSVQQEYINKIGNSFLVRAESGSNKLKLENVESGPQHEGLEQFRLVFSGKSSDIPENIYSVTHLATLKTQKMKIDPSQSKKNHFVSSFCLLS